MGILRREVGQAEDEHVEHDAADVKRDQGDEDLPEHGLQVHVVAVQHRDGQDVACNGVRIVLCTFRHVCLLSFPHFDFLSPILTSGIQLNNHAKSENLTALCFGKKNHHGIRTWL